VDIAEAPIGEAGGERMLEVAGEGERLLAPDQRPVGLSPLPQREAGEAPAANAGIMARIDE